MLPGQVHHNILQYNPDPEAEDREGEIWKPVPGWLVEGNHTRVSNQGRVRNSNGVVFKPERQESGYVLSWHRVIVVAFGVEPPSPHHTEVHHINHIRHDNRLENLAWITPRGFDVTYRTPGTTTRTGGPTPRRGRSPSAPSGYPQAGRERERMRMRSGRRTHPR
jgi:hypothetical protein